MITEMEWEEKCDLFRAVQIIQIPTQIHLAHGSIPQKGAFQFARALGMDICTLDQGSDSQPSAMRAARPLKDQPAISERHWDPGSKLRAEEKGVPFLRPPRLVLWFRVGSLLLVFQFL